MIAEQVQKGIIAQLKAELKANELGYIVSKPTTENCRYDMIIDYGIKLNRIQIKYCSHNQKSSSNSITLNLSKYYINKKQKDAYTKDEIDAIVVYIPEIDKLCYLPIDIIDGKKSITLRYKKTKNNQKEKIKYCSDYFW